MPKPTNRRLLIFAAIAVFLVVVPSGLWLSITHEPSFYRTLVDTPDSHREEEAKQFIEKSLQLRNDIVNEPSWEALYSDQQVNAWLAEDLVKHFADQIPAEVHDPRVMFENDRITVAFKLDQGPISTVVWIVARVWVPEDNILSVAFEKVRAGALPVPTEKFLEPLASQAKSHGLELTWKQVDGIPVASIRYPTKGNQRDVVLEKIQVVKGQVRLSGRSTRERGPIASPILPDRRILQLNFPNRKSQDDADAGSPAILRSEAGPSS